MLLHKFINSSIKNEKPWRWPRYRGNSAAGRTARRPRAYLLRVISLFIGFIRGRFSTVRTFFPGRAGFLNLGGKTEGTAKQTGKNGKNGREMA